MTRGEFAEAMYSYCIMTGASETSGMRTRARNTREGGVMHSAHLVKLASDVTYDSVVIAESERREWAHRLGLMLITEGDHDHLQPEDWIAG